MWEAVAALAAVAAALFALIQTLAAAFTQRQARQIIKESQAAAVEAVGLIGEAHGETLKAFVKEVVQSIEAFERADVGGVRHALAEFRADLNALEDAFEETHTKIYYNLSEVAGSLEGTSSALDRTAIAGGRAADAIEGANRELTQLSDKLEPPANPPRFFDFLRKR